jgi:hypothetical protein
LWAIQGNWQPVDMQILWRLLIINRLPFLPIALAFALALAFSAPFSLRLSKALIIQNDSSILRIGEIKFTISSANCFSYHRNE